MSLSLHPLDAPPELLLERLLTAPAPMESRALLSAFLRLGRWAEPALPGLIEHGIDLTRRALAYHAGDGRAFAPGGPGDRVVVGTTTWTSVQTAVAHVGAGHTTLAARLAGLARSADRAERCFAMGALARLVREVARAQSALAPRRTTLALERLAVDRRPLIEAGAAALCEGEPRSVRWMAAELLEAIGPGDGDAACALERAIFGDPVGARCVTAFRAFGEPARPLLERLARDSIPSIRNAAVAALTTIDAEATRGPVPDSEGALRPSWTEDEERVRAHLAELPGGGESPSRVAAAAALGEIGLGREEVGRALVAAFDDPVHEVRREARQAAGRVQGAAVEAIVAAARAERSPAARAGAAQASKEMLRERGSCLTEEAIRLLEPVARRRHDEREILELLDSIEQGSVRLECDGEPADRPCHRIRYHASNGWILTVYNDMGAWSHLEDVESVDGRFSNLSDFEAHMPAVHGYRPAPQVGWSAYGMPDPARRLVEPWSIFRARIEG